MAVDIIQPQTPKDTRSDRWRLESRRHTNDPSGPRVRACSTHCLAHSSTPPGTACATLYDGALHGARRLRDLREDRRARHRARRHLHLHRRAAAGAATENVEPGSAPRGSAPHRDHNRRLHLRQRDSRRQGLPRERNHQRLHQDRSGRICVIASPQVSLSRPR